MSSAINTERKSIWQVLEHPLIYKLSQAILGPGAEKSIVGEIKKLLTPAMTKGRNLDIGCGPSSLLWQVNLRPIGLEPVHAYNVRFVNNGSDAITGSATDLPFCDQSFDSIWNFGLLHHLSDEMVYRSLMEMIRVVRPGGHVVIFDGLMPEHCWPNPFIWLLRKFDRGQHMRKQSALESLLIERNLWSVNRFQYCCWGHEGVFCIFSKPAHDALRNSK